MCEKIETYGSINDSAIELELSTQVHVSANFVINAINASRQNPPTPVVDTVLHAL